MWNTYGPTEATVVACAARLTGEGPVRIGLPLAGWELAVVGPDGEPVAMAQTGELVIGGVGLARYSTPPRTPRSSRRCPPRWGAGVPQAATSVRAEPAGLLFLGRGDEQVKLGGRRIELGEIDAALQALPGVAGAAAAVKRTAAGNQLLVGYVVPREGFDAAAAALLLREQLPAALVPLLAEVPALPTRNVRQGGPDGAAVAPGPAERRGRAHGDRGVAGRWLGGDLGVRPAAPDADFFSNGGSSLGSAQLVAWIRRQHPQVSVADVYQHPRLSELAAVLDALGTQATVRREVRPTPRRAGLVQGLLMLPMLALVGLRWLTVLAALGQSARADPVDATGVLVVDRGRRGAAAQPGRADRRRGRGSAAAAARGAPGRLPARRRCHLRLWAAERLAELTGATGVAGAGWMITYAKLLGARIGQDVDCTPRRRSPAGCGSAAGWPSSPRSTCPATGSTATWSGSARSGSAPAAGSARAAR